jgi:hypothetical protein
VVTVLILTHDPGTETTGFSAIVSW